MIADRIGQSLKSASWIRRMFEEGNRLRQQFGADNVFDFSLGNPHLEPPAAVVAKLKQITENPPVGMHRYMGQAGFPAVRAQVSRYISEQEGMEVNANQVIMTGGAACGLNILFRALLNPGDQVITFAPYFSEYVPYLEHAQGELVFAETDEEFLPIWDSLANAITPRTRALLLCSPNNPTGRVYSAEVIDQIIAILEKANRDRSEPILLVSDDPYRRVVFDGITVPTLFSRYPSTVLIASFSKDLGLAGERIGYSVVSPRLDKCDELIGAMCFTLRTLGFVNAPALQQLAVADCLQASVDVAAYQKNRELLCSGLQELGYPVVPPDGAFFLFLASPVRDEMEFVNALMAEQILAVPGRSFGRSGYVRLSFAVDPLVIKRALAGFGRVRERFLAAVPRASA